MEEALLSCSEWHQLHADTFQIIQGLAVCSTNTQALLYRYYAKRMEARFRRHYHHKP